MNDFISLIINHSIIIFKHKNVIKSKYKRYFENPRGFGVLGFWGFGDSRLAVLRYRCSDARTHACMFIHPRILGTILICTSFVDPTEERLRMAALPLAVGNRCGTNVCLPDETFQKWETCAKRPSRGDPVIAVSMAVLGLQPWLVYLDRHQHVFGRKWPRSYSHRCG